MKIFSNKIIIYIFYLAIITNLSCNNKTPIDSSVPFVPITMNDETESEKSGFGVSGLLFNNNLIMWDRDYKGSRSELFLQMYFTRVDAANFPVWVNLPTELIISGGVSRDGIPALSNPFFSLQNSPGLSYLQNSDLVLGVVINGDIRAYPENILWWHEVINDKVGGEKVIISFCPLTGSGLLLKAPPIDSEVEKLELLPVIETTWGKWKELYPETKVLTQETGFDRDYRVYPYRDYRDENSLPLFQLSPNDLDVRFPAKHKVLGLIFEHDQKAYPYSKLNTKPVINDSLNEIKILITSELQSELVIPYNREIDGMTLEFDLISEIPFQMSDFETQSIWNLKGEAVSGPLVGKKLKQIPAYNAFWFAWSAFWPSTLVYGE